MPLQKTPVSINFAQGIDTKTDPNQLPIGKFISMQNSVFNTAGRLTKRNGFANIATLPNDDQTTLTTFNDNLLATGSSLYAYNADINTWINRGTIQPVDLSVKPLVRVSTTQSSPDMAIAPNGLLCSVYVDTAVAYYCITDSVTGQQIVSRTAIASTAAIPRVFLLGNYFIITFLATVSAASHIQYIAIPTMNPTNPLTATDLGSNAKNLSAAYDCYVANNALYIAYAATGTTLKVLYLNALLVAATPVTISTTNATYISVTADITQTTPTIWVSFWDSGTTNGASLAYSPSLALILGATNTIATSTIQALTSIASGGTLVLIYEFVNTYSYTPNTRTDAILNLTLTEAGVLGSPALISRSVGLISKAFLYNAVPYFWAAYQSTNQSTYFLINLFGNIIAKLAYANGTGYVTNQVLPSVSTLDNTMYFPYLIKTFLAAVNKGTNLPSGTPNNGIFTQTGINLCSFSINTSGQYSNEIASSLNLTGGQLWQYDGVKPVEQGFHLYPDDNTVTTSTSGGSILANTYYYVFTYEWTDNQGYLHRSAPSIPVVVTTTGSTSTNTLNVPTLRLTYKTTPNPVRIVGYRWSVAQQVYYQFTSITSPTLNTLAADSVTITDTLADASILGNPLLYTTGGVVENIGAPACSASALFKNRLFLIDAEDRNLLWYSKQVIESTPVEMSDLLTVFVAPTTGSQGSTGPMTALSAMDDKLIIFKENAIYYMTGTGPDNTGANNDFTDPIYITSAVGCSNPNSIVLMPSGIMFQSNKGIWLLGRDLSTNYIGAAVEQYNSSTVLSAECIPGTNQVRFILDSNITLMFDYYYNQWGTFSNIRAISACLYQGLHSYLNSAGEVLQESIGSYLDGTVPVLMSFQTGWVNLAGLQGFERFYQAYLLGTYYSPFKLNVQFAYDYNSSATQNVIVTPDNFAQPWGGESVWGGGGGWGGPGNTFEARIFPSTQKCESFQVTINELYDASLGQAAGQGLSLSGMNLVVGAKKGYRTQKASRSFG